MVVSVANQVLTFLLSLLVGALLGAVYDIFRIIRLIHCGKAAAFVEDFLFFLICACVTFFFLLQANSGEIRLFILEGEVLGAILYYFTLGVLVMKAAKAGIGVSRRFAHFASGAMRPHIARAHGAFDRRMRGAKTKIGNLLKIENKLLKINLKPKRNLLYNLHKGKKAAKMRK